MHVGYNVDISYAVRVWVESEKIKLRPSVDGVHIKFNLKIQGKFMQMTKHSIFDEYPFVQSLLLIQKIDHHTTV